MILPTGDIEKAIFQRREEGTVKLYLGNYELPREFKNRS